MIQHYFFNWYWDPGKEHTSPWLGRWRIDSFYLPWTSFFQFYFYFHICQHYFWHNSQRCLVVSLYFGDLYYCISSYRWKIRRQRGKYNRITWGYCDGILPNGNRCLKITLLFCNGCDRFNNNIYYFQRLICNASRTSRSSTLKCYILSFHIFFYLILKKNDCLG